MVNKFEEIAGAPSAFPCINNHPKIHHEIFVYGGSTTTRTLHSRAGDKLAEGKSSRATTAVSSTMRALTKEKHSLSLLKASC